MSDTIKIQIEEHAAEVVEVDRAEWEAAVAGGYTYEYMDFYTSDLDYDLTFTVVNE